MCEDNSVDNSRVHLTACFLWWRILILVAGTAVCVNQSRLTASSQHVRHAIVWICRREELCAYDNDDRGVFSIGRRASQSTEIHRYQDCRSFFSFRYLSGMVFGFNFTFAAGSVCKTPENTYSGIYNSLFCLIWYKSLEYSFIFLHKMQNITTDNWCFLGYNYLVANDCI